MISWEDLKTTTEGKHLSDEIVRQVNSISTVRKRRTKTDPPVEYINTANAFDTETTSFYNGDGEKQACVYEWTVGISGYVIFGRTYPELLDFYNWIKTSFNLSMEKRMVFYVHNLAFDFQFIRKHFEWYKVFSIEDRKPVYAITTDGIEFRCSYILSGYPLATLDEQLQTYHISKTKELEYTKRHNSKTVLTEQELHYCENDVRVVMAYIQERIEEDGNITKVPLTKTSYVRRYCRNSCLYGNGSHKKNVNKYIGYSKIMKRLTLTVEEYLLARAAFQGGITHASAWYSGKTLYDIGSIDFTSSYPAALVAFKYPMGKGEAYRIKDGNDFRTQMLCYCCIFEIEFVNIAATQIEQVISMSKCSGYTRIQTNNGKVVDADILRMTITNVDFDYIKRFYKWDSFRIGKFYRYPKAYLPTELVRAILKLYGDKTKLKGVAGREYDYQVAKGMLNSVYGMCVTDICRDEIVYEDNTWKEPKPCNVEEELNKYNGSKNRFLSYLWGIFCTAYARSNLATGILEFGTDYVYCDTDSIKCKNLENHMEYIERYNQQITDKLRIAMDYHGMDVSLIEPETVKGKKKPLGVWDIEEGYDKFKTLGAKRYMTEKDGELSITVAGVCKETAVPWLIATYGKEGAFDAFVDGLEFPSTTVLDVFDEDGQKIDNPCGKLCHTYIDDEMSGLLTDDDGNIAEYHELSGVHLEATSYNMSLTAMYINYLMTVQERINERV